MRRRLFDPRSTDAAGGRDRLQNRHVALEDVRPGIANQTHHEETLGLGHEDRIAVPDRHIARQPAVLNLTKIDGDHLGIPLVWQRRRSLDLDPWDAESAPRHQPRPSSILRAPARRAA